MFQPAKQAIATVTAVTTTTAKATANYTLHYMKGVAKGNDATVIIVTLDSHRSKTSTQDKFAFQISKCHNHC